MRLNVFEIIYRCSVVVPLVIAQCLIISGTRNAVFRGFIYELILCTFTFSHQLSVSPQRLAFQRN